MGILSTNQIQNLTSYKLRTMPLISVVSPEYKGAKIIPELVARNIASISTITDDFEIILVNDGSPDDSWAAIKKECAKDSRVKGINLSRNFGQHYAISAGLACTKGDWVVVMDCDLQDRPEVIPVLLNTAKEGFDYVQVRRINKKFNFWKRMTSIWFHAALDWLSGAKTDAAIGNFGIYSKQVINAINEMPESIRSLGSQLRYVGFNGASVDIEHSDRAEGHSSYTLSKLIKHAQDVIIANSNKPLKIAVKLGLTISIVSFLLAIYNIIARIVGLINVPGYTTTVFSIWFVGGLLLLMLGIIGLYLGKVFDQVKGRPFFIIKDKVNFDEQ